MKLIFAGTPEFAAQSLRAILSTENQVVLVLTQPDRPAGRGMVLQPSAVKQVALAHGLPVITTRGAPWADLEAHGCGWWVDIGVDPLVHALREAMALSGGERRAMGARGRDYVRRYAWGSIAQTTIDVYRWVLGQAQQPDCVRLD